MAFCWLAYFNVYSCARCASVVGYLRWRNVDPCVGSPRKVRGIVHATRKRVQIRKDARTVEGDVMSGFENECWGSSRSIFLTRGSRKLVRTSSETNAEAGNFYFSKKKRGQEFLMSHWRHAGAHRRLNKSNIFIPYTCRLYSFRTGHVRIIFRPLNSFNMASV